MSMVTKLAAHKMLQLSAENREHIKRAHALRLLYKQAELGLSDLPRSYSEVQEKVASLCNQDLNVLEKALEVGAGNFSLGSIHSVDPLSGGNPETQFMASMLGEL